MTPIRIKVDPSHDASKVKAEGPGLSRSGKFTFSVDGLSVKYLNIESIQRKIIIMYVFLGFEFEFL